MVKTDGCAVSSIRQQRLRLGDRGGRADVEPQALMDDAEAAARLDRAAPQQVRRKGSFGRVLEQPARDELNSGVDEGCDPARLPAAEMTQRVHMEIAPPVMAVRA